MSRGAHILSRLNARVIVGTKPLQPLVNVCSSQRHSRTTALRTLAFDAAALAAVRAYIGQLAWASRQVPFSVNDSDAEIASKAEQFAVFRLSC